MTNDVFFANVEKVAKRHSIKIFKDGKLNIWGIRTPKGEFNDYFKLWYYNGNTIVEIPLIKGTTEPGQSWLHKVMGNKNGTAVLMHNMQYFDCWQLGLHKGKYKALTQSPKAKFIVWRDANQDGDADYDSSLFYDVGGLNFHSTKLGYAANYIGAFSAGCQVVWSWDEYINKVIPFIESRKDVQKTFSYTLVLSDEFV